MIYFDKEQKKQYDRTHPVWVNTWRPDITPETREFWSKFHALVKETSIKVTPSTAFYFVEDILSKPDSGYLGGGFQYLFWFQSPDDRAAFMFEVDKALPGFSHHCEFSR